YSPASCRHPARLLVPLRCIPRTTTGSAARSAPVAEAPLIRSLPGVWKRGQDVSVVVIATRRAPRVTVGNLVVVDTSTGVQDRPAPISRVCLPRVTQHPIPPCQPTVAFRHDSPRARRGANARIG